MFDDRSDKQLRKQLRHRFLQDRELGPPESHEEVVRRLPEVAYITRENLRSQVVDIIIQALPRYWWHAPASGSGKYRPPEHNRQYGLWFHTKRAFTVFEDLIPTTKFDSEGFETDCGRTAILLHDMFKYGIPERAGGNYVYSDGDTADRFHDTLAADWLEKNTDLPTEVVDCVRSHNGKWGNDAYPRSHLEWAHHRADYLASRKNLHGIAVHEPCSELRQQFEDVIQEVNTS